MSQLASLDEMRSWRMEVHDAAGRWKWGQWFRPEGTGPLADRLEWVARYAYTCEPADSVVKVYRHVPHDLDPLRLVLTLTGGVKIPPIPETLDPSQASH